ncbi:MAG: apolipoprotein N-acyltransferase [Rubripirellula sp.]|nr:apolipoprotein N-acyltransferase [Rubripirellula sp.]
MSKQKQNENHDPIKRVAWWCSLSAISLWVAQPPLGLWPVACIALLPWLHLARTKSHWTKRTMLVVWSISAIYYFFSLQGLRHAHPLMIFPTLALASYLAVYHFLFVILLRNALRRSASMILAAPVIWVGLECIRNYFLTGISALMLAHSLADCTVAIQIADLFGSYGISFVLVATNVAIESSVQIFRRNPHRRINAVAIVSGLILVAATLLYGSYRLEQPLEPSQANFALIQRSEPVEYVQSDERAVEIFQAYLRQTEQAIEASDVELDAVIWPESMFSAGLPWMTLAEDVVVPPEANISRAELTEFVNQGQIRFSDRVAYVRSILDRSILDPAQADPPVQLLVGCGVVRYSQQPEVYSGVIQIDTQGEVADWYGKTHLVMFGEYIPIAAWIPGVRSLIPAGMGLTEGPGPRVMNVGRTTVLPVICIETAVERIVVNQLAEVSNQSATADVLVTVTNDGWFDDSSVIEHHLRCGQLVAVATRRPLLSAANNGPTAWIDSRGQVVERLETGSEGALIASPQLDARKSLYVRIGAIPAWICALGTIAIGLLSRQRISSKPPVTSSDQD